MVNAPRSSSDDRGDTMKLETKENEFCEDRTAFTSKSLTESEIAWVARARASVFLSEFTKN
jgi:hypothetical protein